MVGIKVCLEKTFISREQKNVPRCRWSPSQWCGIFLYTVGVYVVDLLKKLIGQ